jgi:PAS domain S-box-containing protein
LDRWKNKQQEAALCGPISEGVTEKSIRVLHVDDEPAFVEMTKQCLELAHDIQVEPATSAEEALAKLDSEKFDVIVSDYQMADMDGIEFLQEIKARGIIVPFILFTGKGREEVAIKALNSGAFRYLNKRGSPDAAHAELASCIRQATQHARTQQKLEENERRFRAIFDFSIDAIMVLDDGGKVLYCNKSARDMLDYGKCELTDALKTHFSRQFKEAYEKNMHEGFGQLDSSRFMTGKTVEISIKKCNGDIAFIELSFSAFAEQGIWYGISIARDLTERKKQEKLLEKALLDSRILNDKIKVLGNVSRHDIRNKLGIVEGNLYLAKKKCKIEPDLEKYLSSIEESTKSITNILDFAKTYEMIGVEKLSPEDVGRTFQYALSLFPDVEDLNIENRCIGIEVMADSLFIEIFHILIGNSLAQRRKPKSIRLLTERQNESSIKLFYKDDGVGFDKSARQNLFKRESAKSAGFSMYLVSEISSSYGWSVRETGQKEIGVQFEFTIPIEKFTKYA